MNLEWITRHIGKVEQYLDERKEDQYNPKWLAAKCKLTAIINTAKRSANHKERECKSKAHPSQLTPQLGQQLEHLTKMKSR